MSHTRSESGPSSVGLMRGRGTDRLYPHSICRYFPIRPLVVGQDKFLLSCEVRDFHAQAFNRLVPFSSSFRELRGGPAAYTQLSKTSYFITPRSKLTTLICHTRPTFPRWPTSLISSASARRPSRRALASVVDMTRLLSQLRKKDLRPSAASCSPARTSATRSVPTWAPRTTSPSVNLQRPCTRLFVLSAGT